MRITTPRRTRPALEVLDERTLPAALAPVYTATFADAVTSDNAATAVGGKVCWTIDPGADQYQTDTYERPVAQTFQVHRLAGGGEAFGAKEYLSSLDLAEAKAGYDGQYLYLSLKVAGLHKWTEDGKASYEGLAYRYGFRLATEADGRGGVLVTADQPQFKVGTTWGGLGTFVYQDRNGDVGGTGRDVTKQDRQAEVSGNGYERVAASDGRAGGRQVVWVRVSPNDPTAVEFAVDYSALGFTAEDLADPAYLEVEANKGLKDPANYAWNDEYTKSEAGSPYRAETGDRSKSEFRTQGLGNIYELDTLRGGRITPPPPEGGTASLAGSVYVEGEGDGAGEGRDPLDAAIEGVTITLTGTDLFGNAIPTRTAVTDENGYYLFADLPAGTYEVTQPEQERLATFEDSSDYVGEVNGLERGRLVGNDRIGEITLADGEAGEAYDFTELYPIGG